ncbi:acetoin utilization protein AcuC [Pelagibius sp. Alg239-R121]|uniref:acetoin utilization protein AcuC n=1 Tax=Pelagibius sp. Alg239-R121 TaxID=2993448 RepID=UPI0024A75A01|nr:acetoin utilization protein AcuC [Pelagibius sp. Alg239-R121]
MTREPQFIGSEIYRRSTYGMRHPLAIPRVSTCIDLCRAMGWLPDRQYHDSPLATDEQLARFHTPDYIAALKRAEADQTLSAEERETFNLGRNGNPIFSEVFRRPATASGGSILAAQLVANAGVVYNPAGGTHHGRPDHASGFCFFNDPALCILELLDKGAERVFYLDVDAHHGDGVQDAFGERGNVMTLSVHENGRWPMNARESNGSGTLEDRAGGMARNLPVPADFNDSEMDYIMEACVLPLLDEFGPDTIVLQCGADGLADDPMSRLDLSNGALWRVAGRLLGRAGKFIVLGGGGYNPWSVGRCWAGIWAVLNGYDIPDRLPDPAIEILRALSWRHSKGRNPPDYWMTTLLDPARPGPVRPEIRDIVAEVLRP